MGPKALACGGVGPQRLEAGERVDVRFAGCDAAAGRLRFEQVTTGD